VEHPCSQCGAAVEDGTAFCRQCNAPQIRVTLAEPLPQSPAGSGEILLPKLSAFSLQPGVIQWSQAFPATAFAGVIAVLSMLLPLGLFGLGMLAAGIIAVRLYRRRVPLVVTPGMGATLGAASGGFGFCIFAIFTAVAVTVFHAGGQLRAALITALEQSAARSSDPQAQTIVAQLKTPEGLAFVMAFGLALTLVVFVVLCSIGGAIGAAWLGRPRGY